MDSKNVMFSAAKIPPYSYFEVESTPHSIQRIFEIFHQTASDVSYSSRGEDRRDEEHCIFHFTLAGKGEVIYNGQRYTVSAGQGFFNIINAADCGYGYPECADEPWEFIVLCFDGAGVREVVGELCEYRSIYEVDAYDLTTLCREAIRNEQGRISAFPRLISLICSYERESVSLVEDFVRYVTLHVEENPTVSSVASELGVTREHLSRVYLQNTGKTPALFIKGKRYERLCDFIASGMAFDKIAERLRFPSVSGMSLFFKKMSGISPSEYRKKGYLKI